METLELKKGDKVKLISLDRASDELDANWILYEACKPKIGDIFQVEYAEAKDGWIGCKGLKFMHPRSKFELAN